MYTVQILPRTDKVCTLYRLYQGQTRYIQCTDCTKERQDIYTVQIVPRTDKVCTLNILYQGQTRYIHSTLYRLYQGQTGCMYTVQIVPRTDKVCTLYRLYRGQTRYVHCTDQDRQGIYSVQIVPIGQTWYLRYTDCTKDRQGIYTEHIIPRTDKVCTLYRLYQGQTRYVRYTDCTKDRHYKEKTKKIDNSKRYNQT